MFISGRYEYRNKGVDMYLEGLARLNSRLKQYNSPVNVVAFIIMPAQTHNYNIESLKGQAVTKQLRDVVGEVSKAIEEKIFESALR
jgi:glycogen synthase